jgi:hypothetical protein
MRIPFRLIVTAAFVLAAFSSPLFAKDKSHVSADRVDDEWADRALSDPGMDEGWMQSCSDNVWNDGRVAHCEVREFSYSRGKGSVAIDGGNNSGMTVMGSDRDDVRILYRVIARASTEDRARALVSEIQLERTEGWLRPAGPEESKNEWWTVEIKVWVPRTSDLALKAQNGPMGVRDVRGTMDLSSENGPVSLTDLGGDVEAHVQNGPLHVALSGSRWDGAGLVAEAQNGPVNLVLPAKYSAKLVTGTINGPRTFDYAIESNGRRGWITTTLGKGGPPVRVVTHNGPFQMEER